MYNVYIYILCEYVYPLLLLLCTLEAFPVNNRRATFVVFGL